MAESKKWNMVMDLARCHDCNNCFLACKDEFVGNDFPPYSVAQPWAGQRWMNILRAEGGQYPKVQVNFLTLLCQQCDNPSCTTPDGAVYKRADGIVIIDPQKAAGRKDIVESCPYGAIYWNEEKNVAQKCIGCAHLLDAGWKEPRCTQVCPTGAIKFVLADDAEMARLAAEESLEHYLPELGSQPRVYYKNLHRWNKAFLAGNVILGDTDECGEGASIRLSSGGQVVAEAVADEFGDFFIEKLETGTDYEVSARAEGYRPASAPVRLQKSWNMGSIRLEKQTA
jgi:Fe-S-cluster-containing dehydrogenase component